MHEYLRSKKATIHHSEVPQELLKISKVESEGSSTTNIVSDMEEEDHVA